MGIDHRTSQTRRRAGVSHLPTVRQSLCGVALAIAAASSALGAGQSAAAPVPVPPPNMKPAPAPAPLRHDPIDGFVGRTYDSVAVLGGVIPGGGPLVVSFGPQRRIGLSAGCNQHGGRASMAGDRLTIGPMISTMMACPGPRGGADRWLTSFTSTPITWRAFGPVLILQGPHETVVLTQR